MNPRRMHSFPYSFFVTIACLIGIAIFLPLRAGAATVIDFPNFSSCAGLQLNGTAACTSGVLRLTPDAGGSSGSAFSSTQISLGPGASFSTLFSFQMTGGTGSCGDGDGPGADGLTFTVQPVSSSAGGGGGGLGYSGIANSLAVELDTFNNGSPADPDGNHAGIDLNGSVVSVATASIPTRFNNGSEQFVWVDYDGTTLEVRVSQNGTRPSAATLTDAVDLASVLGTTQAYVGFTAGTGSCFNAHEVVSWQFSNTFAPIGGVDGELKEIPTLSEWGLVILATLLAIFGFVQGRRRG